MAFAAFEPSDAMLQAMQARFKNKNICSAIGERNAGSAINISGSAPPAAVTSTSAAFTGSVAACAAAGIPAAEARGASVPSYQSSAPQTVSFARAPVGGFRTTEAPGRPAPAPPAANSFSLSSSRGDDSGYGGGLPLRPMEAPSISSSPPAAPLDMSPLAGTSGAHRGMRSSSRGRLPPRLPDDESVQCRLSPQSGHEGSLPPLLTEGGSRPSSAGRRAASAQGRATPSQHDYAASPHHGSHQEGYSPRPGSDILRHLPSERVGQACEWMGTKAPTAVTVGGVPVATDGELVYLGGGVWGAPPAATVERPPPQRKRPPQRRPGQRIVPGRVSSSSSQSLRGPRGAALRSASAHLVGGGPMLSQRLGEVLPSEFSPSNRAKSDGQIGLGGLRTTPSTASSAPAAGGDRRQPAGPRAWRPSGPAKLPLAPTEPAARARRAESEDVLPCTPGRMRSDARADERREKKRDGLFGGQGLLAQLRAGEAAAAALNLISEAGAGRIDRGSGLGSEAGGTPRPKVKAGAGGLSSEQRAAERRAAKDERNRLLLEEREMRLQAESVEATLKAKKALAPVRRGPGPSASSPALGLGLGRSQGEAKEGLQRKMDLLNLMNGYSKNLNNLTPEQTAGLLAQLNAGKLFGGAARRRPGEAAPRYEEEEDEEANEGRSWAEDEEGDEEADNPALFAAAAGFSPVGASHHAEEPEVGGAPAFLMGAEGNQGSLQDRLRSLNEECTRAFEDDLDDLDL